MAPHATELGGEPVWAGDIFSKFIRKYISRKAWLAVRVAGWLCLTPILIRIYGLPALLRRLAPSLGVRKGNSAVELEQAVSIVVWVCRWRVFRLPIFPKPCLRQSLALYRTLSRMGHRAEIHFGVNKKGQTLYGHSWVTLQGQLVAESSGPEVFKSVYSYSSGSYGSFKN